MVTMRSRLTIAAVGAAISVGSAYLAQTEAPANRSPLWVEPLTHDFGVVRQGSAVSVTFRLTNMASDPLRIMEVLSGCDCTSAEIPQHPLDPGETVEFPVTWKVGSRRNQVSSDLLILSSFAEGELSTSRLTLRANVESDVAYDPLSLTFKEGCPEKRIVTISPGAMKTLVLSKAYSTHRAFVAEVLPGARQVQVTFDPQQWESDIGTGCLIVETNSPNEPQCKVPLKVSDLVVKDPTTRCASESLSDIQEKGE